MGLLHVAAKNRTNKNILNDIKTTLYPKLSKDCKVIYNHIVGKSKSKRFKSEATTIIRRAELCKELRTQLRSSTLQSNPS